MKELKAAIALAHAHAAETEQRIASQLIRVSQLAIEDKAEEARAIRVEIAQLEEILVRIRASIDAINRRLDAA